MHKYLFSLSLNCQRLRKQSTFRDAKTGFSGFPTKWRLRIEPRNSILMTHHYPDLGGANDWLKICFNQSAVFSGYKCNHSNESYWTVLSRGTIYCAGQGGSNFEFLDAVLECDHSDKKHWAALSCGTVYYAVQGGSIFWVYGWNPKLGPFTSNVLCRTSLSWLSHCSYECSYSRTS